MLQRNPAAKMMADGDHATGIGKSELPVFHRLFRVTIQFIVNIWNY